MVSPWMGPAVKVVAALLMIANVTMHGIVALFIGGPLGLGLYLVAFVTFWTGAWVMLRRSHQEGV